MYPHQRIAAYFDSVNSNHNKPKSKKGRSTSFSTSTRAPIPSMGHPGLFSSPTSSYSSNSTSQQPYIYATTKSGTQTRTTRTRTRTYSVPNPSYTINPLLKYHPHPSDVLIKYDLSHPPSQATVVYSGSPSPSELSPSDLNSPATYPPVQTLRVTNSLLPWPVVLHPISEFRSVITVGDVLEGLFRFLRKHASGDEWHSADEQTREDVRQAWMRRVRRQQTHKDREYERSNGLRRIDWLDKATVFQGLEFVQGSDTWVLHVRQADKAVKFWTGS
ncbi:hypothetical protein Clacol_009478 [Clathrus columnatus]|uniref:DUF6699 domain-containing protein n=1 Tax=Clathrus columnatus TaxID=1419009 RepID=A0AAV5AN32_9AGAM|nr:hypothetical protein Clacol_009478 [Clathrus columnatus]